jgi:DNA-binding beta-propeller fold protein YncE
MVVRAQLALVSLLLVSLAAGCQHVSLVNLPCPCAPGWICCPGENVCVEQGGACPVSSFAVTPSPAHVRFGGSVQLSATEPASWSIVEGASGGSVDDSGTYQAPLAKGPFHVVATSLAHPGRQAMVEVSVGPTRIDLAAGQLGGPGYLDGLGTSARFGQIHAIWDDGAGSLFVTEGSGGPQSTLRKIDLTSGAVTTLLSVASSSDGTKLGRLTADEQGRLYVEKRDTSFKILRVDPHDGSSTVVADIPFDPSSSGRGLEVVSGLVYLGGNLYVADEGGFIRRVSLADGSTNIIAGDPQKQGNVDGVGSSALFDRLSDMVLDASGNLLIADYASCSIRKLDPTTLQVTTALATASPCPQRIAVVDGGSIVTVPNLGSAQPGLNDSDLVGVMQVGSLSSPNYFVAQWRTDQDPSKYGYGVALWNAGSTLYVGDGSSIRAVGPLMTVSGRLTLSNVGGDAVLAGLPSAAGIDDGPIATARLNAPRTLAVNSTGRIYAVDDGVLDWYSNTDSSLRAIDGAGVTTVLASRFGSLTDIRGMTVDDSDQVYVTNDASLFALTPRGLDVVVPKDNNNYTIAYPFYLARALAADGTAIYAVDSDWPSSHVRIRRFDLATKEVSTVAVGPLLDYYASSLTSDRAGRLFLGTRYSAGIFTIDTKTGAFAPLPGAPPDLTNVTALAYDPVGLLYVADGDGNRVRAIDIATSNVIDIVGQDGAYGVRTGALPQPFHAPSGLAVLPSGELAIASSVENAVLIAAFHDVASGQ